MGCGRTAFVKTAAAVVACFALLCVAWAQPAKRPSLAELTREVERVVREGLVTDADLDAGLVGRFGSALSAEKLVVIRRQARALLRHEAFPRWLAMSLHASGHSSVAGVREAAMAGMLELQVKGLRRLSAEQQLAMLTHTIRFVRSLPPHTCKAAFSGQLPEGVIAEAERAFNIQLPLKDFVAITNLYRAAAEAELSAYPDVRTPTANQMERASRAHRQVLRRLLKERLPRLKLQSYDTKTSPAEEVCAAELLNLEAMRALEEPERTWKLMEFWAE